MNFLVDPIDESIRFMLSKAPPPGQKYNYLTEYTYESRFTRAIRFGTESLAGVPSIIFGLFGFIFFVTYLQMGWSILAGGLTLALMVLPTIIRTSEEAIRTVPQSYRDVSYSLGATRWKMVTTAVLPSATWFCGRTVVGTVMLRSPETEGEPPGFDTRRTTSIPNELLLVPMK